MKKLFFTIVNIESEQHSGKSYPLNSARSLSTNLALNQLNTNGKCGGKAICGQCRIQIISGHKSCNQANAEEKVHLSEQELKNGWRLACQIYCLRDVHFYLPESD